MTAAGIADFCGFDVVLAIRLDKGQGSEAFDDAVTRFRARETLQEFLQYEPGAEHLVSSEQRIAQHVNFWRLKFSVPAQCQ